MPKFFLLGISQEYYEPIPKTDSYYRWVDAETDGCRVISQNPNPFDKPALVTVRSLYSKSDRSKYPYCLEIRLEPSSSGAHLHTNARLERAKIKGKFTSSSQSFAFFSFPSQDPLFWITYSLVQPQKHLYLIRGASGSGKTTLGQKLAMNRVISADDFPGLYENGVYRLDLQKTSHQWCLRETENLLNTGFNIAVANTFSRRKQLEPYLELAGRYGYQVSVITCEGNHGNLHGVPEEIRNRQLATFEPLKSLTPFGIEVYLTDLLKNKQLSPEELHLLIDKIYANVQSNSSIKNFTCASLSKRDQDQQGSGEFNENKSNLERKEESSNLVKEAVEYLKNNDQWNINLTKRERIKLIQKYTQEVYSRTISSGTLYQDWCKNIWSLNC